MTKSTPVLLFALAVTGLALITGETVAQDCAACAPAPPMTQQVFGYPSGGGMVGCSDCANTGSRCKRCSMFGSGELKARREHTRQMNLQISARNNVWPQPFDCADRQLYFKMWEAMIDQGFEEQCVLTSAHFTTGTNELNRFGVNTVAGIIQNMPSNRRQIFIHRDVDDNTNTERMANVKNTIKTYYGQFGGAQVAYSSSLPVNIRGITASNIDQKWTEGMQTPVIPISSGEGVASSVGGG